MNSYKLQGYVAKIEEAVNVSKTENPFMKSLLVLDCSDDKYTNTPAFEFTQANADLPAQCKVGDIVEVRFSVTGREWQGKFFTTLRGFSIERVMTTEEIAQHPATQAAAQTAPVSAVPNATPFTPSPTAEPFVNDLPF